MEIAKYAGKAATVGAVGYGAGSVMLPNTAIQLPGGRRIPTPGPTLLYSQIRP